MTLNGNVINGELVLNFRPTEGGPRIGPREPIFVMLAIGWPSNEKTIGELIYLKVCHFLASVGTPSPRQWPPYHCPRRENVHT